MFRPKTTRIHNATDTAVEHFILILDPERADLESWRLDVGAGGYLLLEERRAQVPVAFGSTDPITLPEADRQVRSALGHGLRPA